MTRQIIDQPIEPKERMTQRGRRLGARLAVPLLAALIALLLQGALMLALVETGPLAGLSSYLGGFDTLRHAQAAPLLDDDTDDFTLHYGTVISRPEGKVGIWVISDSVHSVTESYTVTDSSEVESGLGADDCVEVKVAESEPTVALKIVAKEESACGGSDDDDNDQEGYIVRSGVVITRPEVKVGTWVISDTTYTVTEATSVHAIGDFVAVGDCVEVKVAESAPTVAVWIVEKEASRCNDEDDDGEHDDDDDKDDDEEFRHEWEGTIDTVPLELVGEWTISIGANKKLTFTTDLETRFIPALPAATTAFVAGRWVEVKVSRQLDGSLLAERVRVDDYEMGEIVVRLESAAISDTIANKYSLVLTSTLLNQANIYLFTTTNENERFLASQIAQEDGVIWAEVNYVNSVPEEDGYKTWGWGGVVEPDAYLGQSAYQQIRLGYASRAYQGEGVVVAVLDTGVYTPHEQFAGKLNLPSLDVIDDDNDPSEEGPGLAWGHGTHVAGVITAMAPEASILPVRVLDENGRGNTFLLAYAIEWAMQQPGVQVINLSLGTEFDSKILRDVIENATEQGIIVVAAAGNSGTDLIQYPAGYHDVIGVTAVDSNLLKASFANYGKEWVDISAPGVGIMSTMINEDGPGYATWSGTSMATAFVSGAAALVTGKWEIEATHDGNMLGQILETGLVVDALNPLFAGEIGRLLDVSAALEVEAALVFIPQSEK